MTHRIGGRTWDLHQNARLEIGSGVHLGTEIWGHQLTTRGGEIGVPKGGHFGCSKLAKIGGVLKYIFPRRLGDGIRHSICNPLGVKRRLACTWLSRISMALGVVMIQTGSTAAKMAKLVMSGDRSG